MLRGEVKVECAESRPEFKWRYCLTLVSIFALCARAEIGINTQVLNHQAEPAVSCSGEGDFVAVWSDQNTPGGIFARRFDSSGQPIEEQFKVNSGPATNPASPDAAMDSQGNTVFAWQADGEAEEEIYARLFDANAAPLGDEFQVSGATFDRELYPKVAISDSGGFVIAWANEELGGEPDLWSIKCQIYDGQGQAEGNEIEVSVSYEYDSPAVAVDDWGNFTVVWVQYNPATYDRQVMARRYDSNGLTITGVFEVSTADLGSSGHCSIGMAENGSFVALWSGENPSGGDDIYARRYDFDGMPREEPFVVNASGICPRRRPAVYMNDPKNFVVVWESGDVSGSDIFGQRFDWFGNKIGGEFQLNTYVLGAQAAGDVAVRNDGTFLAVWQSEGQDGSGNGIFGEIGPLTGWGDFNYDGLVNFVDYRTLANQWLCEGDLLEADLYDDNKVDAYDLDEFSRQWLRTRYGCQQVDIYSDGRIDFKDYALLAQNWLDSGANLTGDITGDGTVDLEDLQAFVFHWTRGCD